MIVLSSSLRKSGSGWYYQLTNDALMSTGELDSRVVRERYDLHHVLRYANCHIHPSGRNLYSLLKPHFKGESLVVKAHSGPRPTLLGLIAIGWIKVTYNYRDPRDVVLSMLDHGRRVRESNPRHRLAQLDSVEDAARLVQRELAMGWVLWKRLGCALMVRYEDLYEDPQNEVRRLSEFLQLNLSVSVVQSIVERYSIKTATEKVKSDMHLNRAKIGRWRQALSQKELDVCRRYLGELVEEMGYPVQ